MGIGRGEKCILSSFGSKNGMPLFGFVWLFVSVYFSICLFMYTFYLLAFDPLCVYILFYLYLYFFVAVHMHYYFVCFVVYEYNCMYLIIERAFVILSVCICYYQYRFGYDLVCRWDRCQSIRPTTGVSNDIMDFC